MKYILRALALFFVPLSYYADLFLEWSFKVTDKAVEDPFIKKYMDRFKK